MPAWIAKIRKTGHLCLRGDRKSTRLNSSHLVISYAVFCLKKKKHNLSIPYYKHNHNMNQQKETNKTQLAYTPSNYYDTLSTRLHYLTPLSSTRTLRSYTST